MTALVKPLRRQTPWRAPHGVSREVVITLYPGGTIGLREFRRRREIRLDAAALYAQALAKEVGDTRRRRRASIQ